MPRAAAWSPPSRRRSATGTRSSTGIPPRTESWRPPAWASGTDKVVLLSGTSQPREQDAKVNFYKMLCGKLEQSRGIWPSDVAVSIISNSDAN